MNRSIYYSQEQLRSFDLLWSLKDTLEALAYLEQDIAGTTATVVSGLTASPTSPATLNVTLTAGRIYALAAVDSTAYGSLTSDPALVMQQGFAAAQSVALTTSALSSGQSQWALIQASFSQTDVIRTGDPTGGVLYYWNSANPSQPLQGPGNTGATNNTEREGVCTIGVVYGSPATTGSEAPPNATAGWAGLYLIDLTFGQTQITSGQIKTAGPSVGSNVPSNYPYAPFLAGLLNSHHSGNAGQAPQIKLTSEVQGVLPLANLPASNTTGGLAAFRQYAGNPNGNVAGNFNVNGTQDFIWDITDKVLYACIATGTATTAVWQIVGGTSTSQFAGVTTTGTANAQVISSTTPSGFSLTPGYVVTTTIGAGLDNTGAATLDIDATGVIAINKNSGGSNVPLSGGELTAGSFVSFIYTGSVWLLQAEQLGVLATLNIGQWLKNDGAGNLTIKNGLTLGDDGNGNLTVQPGSVSAAMLSAAAAAQRSYVAPTSTQGGGNLTLSNDVTNPNYVVDIAPGRVSDDADATMLQLIAGMTKRLDESWAAGTGNGGCDASSKGPTQTWHCYLIGRTGMAPTAYSRTSNVASLTIANHNLGVGSIIRVHGLGLGFDSINVITAVTTNTLNYSNAGSNVSGTAPSTALAEGFDVLFSQSYPTPTYPIGFNAKQCLGSVLTNSAGNIVPFVQNAEVFILGTMISQTGSLVATSRVLTALGSPLGVKLKAKLRLNLQAPGTSSTALITSPDETDQAVSTNATINAPSGTTAAGEIDVFTNTSGQVGVRGANTSGSLSINLAGWRDPRRRLF